MATIKATTIENLDEELNVSEDLNILVQSSETPAKTKRTTLKNLKSIFGAAGTGGTTQPKGEGEGESDGYQGLNSFDSFEYASE